jgi:hypothetical protein
MRNVFSIAVFAAFVAFATPGSAADGTYGTADEARAMLERAVAAVNADKAQALECSTPRMAA